MVVLIGRAVVQGVKNTPLLMMSRCQSPPPGGMHPSDASVELSMK